MARETYTRFTGPVIGAPISTTLSDDTPANSTSISFRAPSDGRFLFVGGFTHTGSGAFTLKVNDVAAASAITVDTDGGYTETFTTTSFSKYDKIGGTWASVSSAAGANIEIYWKPMDTAAEGSTATFITGEDS